MAFEDFGTFTEEDPNSRIVVGTRRVEWTAIIRAEDAWVVKDKGVGFFDGDFVHYLTIRTTDLSATQSVATLIVHCWAVATAVGSRQDIIDASEYVISVSLRINNSSGTPILELRVTEVVAGDAGASESTSLALIEDTTYYLKIVRDESVGTFGTLYCYVYADAARTNLVGSKSLTLRGTTDFRYVYAMQSLGKVSTGFDHSGYSEDLEFLASLELPIVKTLYNTDFAATTVTGNGGIDNLGLSAVTEHGHVWATTTDPDTTDSKTTLGAGSLGVFTSSITGLIEGQIYHTRAYATNSEGTGYGANLRFVAGRSNLTLQAGEISVKGDQLHYVDLNGKERYVEGILV